MRHLVLLLLCTVCMVPTASGIFWGWWWNSRRRCNRRGPVNPDLIPAVDVEPESRVQTIVGTCTADVGSCPTGQCRYDPFRPTRCPKDGYICPRTETREVDCGEFGKHEVLFVTSCTCCKDNGIKIQGQVVDAADQSPIAYAFLSSESHTFSGSDGTYSLTVKSSITRLVIRAHRRNYLTATKVVDIPQGFRGPIDVRIAMVKEAEPITINAGVENELAISSETTSEPRAKITIPSGSFKTRGGRVYTGNVFTSINFVDPSDTNVEAEIPGQFVTSSGEPLITDGIFALSYRAESGEFISLDPVTVSVRAGMRLWSLSADGQWEPLGTTPGRRKRQLSLTEEILAAIANGMWINIDKIPGAPQCFFKGRVFDQITNTEIISSGTASFRPSAIAYTTMNQRLPFYLPATSQPASTCFTVRCPSIADPADLLIGLIAMESYETVSIGGASLPVVTTLLPRYLPDYSAFSPAIPPQLTAVQYEVTPADEEAFVNFISDVNGPFYTNIADCQNSVVTQASFHFLKPELPSYVPYPDDTAICTARIGFSFSFSITDVISPPDPLPAVTATSTWTEGGTNYYFTDTSVMQLDVQGDDFAYICVQYRCSDLEANTTVFLDIDIPTITVNETFEDDFGNTSAIERPVFMCYGNCTTENCYRGEAQTLSSSVDGSFFAPISIPVDGPNFFQDMPNSCGQQSRNETFAARYYCYGRFIKPQGEDDFPGQQT